MGLLSRAVFSASSPYEHGSIQMESPQQRVASRNASYNPTTPYSSNNSFDHFEPQALQDGQQPGSSSKRTSWKQKAKGFFSSSSNQNANPNNGNTPAKEISSSSLKMAGLSRKLKNKVILFRDVLIPGNSAQTQQQPEVEDLSVSQDVNWQPTPYAIPPPTKHEFVQQKIICVRDLIRIDQEWERQHQNSSAEDVRIEDFETSSLRSHKPLSTLNEEDEEDEPQPWVNDLDVHDDADPYVDAVLVRLSTNHQDLGRSQVSPPWMNAGLPGMGSPRAARGSRYDASSFIMSPPSAPSIIPPTPTASFFGEGARSASPTGTDYYSATNGDDDNESLFVLQLNAPTRASRVSTFVDRLSVHSFVTNPSMEFNSNNGPPYSRNRRPLSVSSFSSASTDYGKPIRRKASSVLMFPFYQDERGSISIREDDEDGQSMIIEENEDDDDVRSVFSFSVPPPRQGVPTSFPNAQPSYRSSSPTPSTQSSRLRSLLVVRGTPSGSSPSRPRSNTTSSSSAMMTARESQSTPTPTLTSKPLRPLSPIENTSPPPRLVDRGKPSSYEEKPVPRRNNTITAPPSTQPPPRSLGKPLSIPSPPPREGVEWKSAASPASPRTVRPEYSLSRPAVRELQKENPPSPVPPKGKARQPTLEPRSVPSPLPAPAPALAPRRPEKTPSGPSSTPDRRPQQTTLSRSATVPAQPSSSFRPLQPAPPPRPPQPPASSRSPPPIPGTAPPAALVDRQKSVRSPMSTPMRQSSLLTSPTNSSTKKPLPSIPSPASPQPSINQISGIGRRSTISGTNIQPSTPKSTTSARLKPLDTSSASIDPVRQAQLRNIRSSAAASSSSILLSPQKSGSGLSMRSTSSASSPIMTTSPSKSSLRTNKTSNSTGTSSGMSTAETQEYIRSAGKAFRGQNFKSVTVQIMDM